MPLLTLTTANTAQPITTDITLPTQHFVRAVTLQVISPATANVYIGLEPPLGKGSAVSSSAYDNKIDGTNYPTEKIGVGNVGNDVDLAATYLVSDTNTTVIAWGPEQA